MKIYGHITGNTEKKFLFIFMNQMVQGDQLSKIFSAVLDHPPLTATPIYSNNQSKLLYMASVTIFDVTLSEKIAKIRKNQIQVYRAISHLKLASCTFMLGLPPLGCSHIHFI